MRRFYEKGEMAKERRGGDRKSQKFEEKRKAVQTLLYLPPELNIKKLWRMYNKDHPTLKVKQHFFRNIFNCCYNIGFGTPRTDVCSTCLLLDENIKKETNAEIKNKLIIEKRVHRLRFKAFYEILREQRSDLLTMSFDCQKNLGLPKVPDQSAYYSRQYNFYNFTIVVGSSKAKLTKDNIFSYVWNKTSHNKGSNEIISAVHHFLTNLEFKEEIKVLRIVADGCSSQNKNTGMLAMLGKWLTIEAARHVKKVEIIFPVVGHSFISHDRIFAQIEKDLKKREVISSPEQYQEIITQYCKLTPLDTIAVQDWKSAYAPIIKPTTSWHLQFQKCKRFFLTRSKTNNLLVQGEQSYRNDIKVKKTITKKNKSITMVIPDVIPANQIIPNKAKVTDVSNLLKKHYGEQWKDIETLTFYKNIEARRSEQEDLEEISEISNDLCENGFDDVNLIV
ncbi:hypothetical protein EVAR_85225_1 [Eumeta japonica]|uniref:DUF7869 domain-containing protein n=1 Tax=Eumeta variegata TaxID=151549 RepID=A0A4C1VZ19_EUMVA|nr:hypothetical protein EVAR_85225_1 [Eumeta japonica]